MSKRRGFLNTRPSLVGRVAPSPDAVFAGHSLYMSLCFLLNVPKVAQDDEIKFGKPLPNQLPDTIFLE